MAIIVTGSSGFVGRNLVVNLAQKGLHPVAFDVVPPPHRWLPEGVPFVRGTMANLEEVMAAIVDHQVQRIIALAYVQAPLNAPEYRDFIGAVKANLLGVTNVFEAARLAGLDRVIFASSCAVYGPQSRYGDRPITEADPLAPTGTYGLMKAVNESLAERYAGAYGLQIIRVRPSAILGAGNTMWPARFVSPVAVGKPGYGNFRPDSGHNVVAVEDLAELYSRLAAAPRVQHDVYLGTGHTFVARDLVAIIRQYVPDAQLEFDESAPPRQLPHIHDNSRAVQEFGWELRSLEAAVLSHINGVREEAGLPRLGV